MANFQSADFILGKTTPGMPSYVQPPNSSIRSLGLEGGSPGAYADLSNRTAQSVSNSTGRSPYAEIGFKLMDLLKQHQQLGTRPFVEQEMNARDEQSNRISAQTSPDLISASPQIQNAVRNASAGAVNPTIQGAQKDMRTFSEQISGFGDVLTSTRQLFKDMEDRDNKARDDARTVINQILTTTDLESIRGLEHQELEQLEKLAGYPKGFLRSATTYKERQLKKSGVGGSAGGQLSALAQAVQAGTISLSQLTPTERGKVAAELTAAGIESPKQLSLQSNLDVVDDLLKNENIGKISGFFQGKLMFGNLDPRAQLAINQFNQIKGILSLENREQLKGSGAISDFEFRVLGQAATALGRNLNNTDFRAQLQKIRDVFAGKYANTRSGFNQNQTSGTIRMSGPGGTFDVPADKVEIFKANGYQPI